jgi:NAD(P)-dependent dehydrogenase (short-subunit alcohol dehydrogenase family)
MADRPWNVQDIPDQTSRLAIVTGANSGTGFEAARALARRGATVVLACRSAERAAEAMALIRRDCPAARLESEPLDLVSLASIRAAAESLIARHPRIDLLLNNAGVMMPPKGTTADGFETQFGTNHLGHFALTGLLLPGLLAAPGSRIVTMSSNAHHPGRIRFDDLQSERHYDPTAAYCQSKLANLLFTYALQRRLERAGARTAALAAHPGWSRTRLERHAALRLPFRMVSRALGPWLSQTAVQGTLPLLRAALDPVARGGEYYGPDGFLGFRGEAVRAASSRRSRDAALQERLSAVSEQLTHVRFPL